MSKLSHAPVFNREIEKKYVLSGTSYEAAIYRLGIMFPDANILQGVSDDTFWTQKGTDFIRLRRNTKELSVKITDKITIEDRVEENVEVGDYDTASRFSTAVFGQPVGSVEKTYYVMTLPDFVISLYKVARQQELFLEVEALEMGIVEDICGLLTDYFEMKQEMRSLFQIVFGDQV